MNPYSKEELMDIHNRLENGGEDAITEKESLAFLAFITDTPFEIMEARLAKIRGEL